MTGWHEEAEFWELFGGTMFDAAAWKSAEEQVGALEALLGIEPGLRVLDLACGPGRHSIPLARRGYRVLGVDRTEHFLEEARRRADDEGLDLDLAHADMREFVEPEAFDVAINMLTSFGYFEDPDEDTKIIGNMFRSLVPGGRVLLDTMGKEIIARIFEHKQWRERDGDFYLYERKILDDWSWIENRWIRIDVDERHEYTVGHRLYSALEFKRLLVAGGFVDVKAYGGLDGRPYDNEAERLVVVGTKPGR